jgi:serine/threonine-protein kinase
MTATTPAPMAAAVAAQGVGSVFAGRYKVEALLGEGGSASVYRAQDLELNEPVAVKIFRPWMQSDALLARFKLELSLSRQINHPNIIRLYDLGTADGVRYLTMELLEGADLASRLSKEGTLPLVDGLRFLEQACIGLQAVHERGVIHRDIKPQNLFVTSDGVVKVMDFGIAKKEQTQGVTVAGTIIGTPEYISPEQINNFSAVTFASDLYSLGATAYTIFTGQPPFMKQALMSVLMAHVNEPPPSARERNPAIPVELEAVMFKLLEKEPEKRFASGKELADALKKIRLGLEAKSA